MSNIQIIDITTINRGGRPLSKKLDYVRFELGSQLFLKIGQRFPGGAGHHFLFELWCALGRYDNQYIGPLDTPEDLEDFFSEIQCDQNESLKIIKWLADRDVIDSSLWNEAKIIWCQDHLNYHEQAWSKRGKIPIKPRKTGERNYEVGLVDYPMVSVAESKVSASASKLSDSVNGLSVTETTQRKVKERKVNKRKGKEGRVPNPPSLEEVIKYFVENGYLKDVAIKMYETYKSNNWHDTKDNPIKSWKLKAQKVWFVPEHRAPTHQEVGEKKVVIKTEGFGDE